MEGDNVLKGQGVGFEWSVLQRDLYRECWVVFTDGEYDDWGALYLLSKLIRDKNVRLVVVVCYRSQAILEQMASDARRFLPKASVRMGPEDAKRDGGYPMDAPLDGLPTPPFVQYPANTRMVLGLSLLDALLLGEHDLWAARETGDEVAQKFGARHADALLWIYGGGYNLRTPLARALFDLFPGKHVRFDGYAAFGNRTMVFRDGSYISALLTKETAGDAFAAHVLQVGRTWNVFLGNKFIDDLWEYGASNLELTDASDKKAAVLGPVADHLAALAPLEPALASIASIPPDALDAYEQLCGLLTPHANLLAEIIRASSWASKKTPLAEFLRAIGKIPEHTRMEPFVSIRDIVSKFASEINKYKNKMRVLSGILADELQGCTADMFAVAALTLCTPDSELFNHSFRMTMAIDEEKAAYKFVTPDAAASFGVQNDALRAAFRQLVESRAAGIVYDTTASWEIPLLKK